MYSIDYIIVATGYLNDKCIHMKKKIPIHIISNADLNYSLLGL